MPIQSRLVRVFISSTFRDFIQERDELVKRVFPELRKKCKERFIELLEVDLRWGITEDQAKGGETLRICLEEIDRCRPSAPVFFLGLLGERYGWIPPKEFFTKEVLEDPNLGWVKEHIEGKSVTELEIIHGVLRNEAMREKAFFYFRNDGYQDRHWPEIQRHHEKMVPPVTKEDFTNAKSDSPGKDEEKQRELKLAIRDASRAWDPRNYETPEEMGRTVLEDLWSAIDRVFPADEVPDDTMRNRLEHDAFGQSRVKGYVNRAGLFERLNSELTNKKYSTVVVTGESGAGKSALLAAWLEQLGETAPMRKFVHYIGGTPESSSAKSIVLHLMNQIRSWGAVVEPVPDDFGEAVEALPEWLARAAEGQDGGVLIVLDALNQLESPRDRSIWWIPKHLPTGVRLVVSNLPGDSEDELHARGWLENKLSVPPLDHQERKQIINGYLGRFTKNLESKLVDLLASAPQTSNPLFLRVVLDELRIRARHEELGPMLTKMLEAKDPAELFAQVLKNLEEFDRERNKLVREAMGYLAVARRGLSEGELLQLLSPDALPAINPLPRHYWSPLYLALEDSFVSRNGQLSFFHNYLQQAVEKEYLDEARERKEVHGRLGEVALTHDQEAFSPSLKYYGLAHGAWHLRRANDLPKLWALLSDEKYRRSQSEACGSSRYTLDGLTEGIDAYADQSEPEIEGDIRLAWLATTRACVLKNEHLEAIPKALRGFATDTKVDDASISKLLAKLNVLNGADHYLATQIVLLMIGLAGRTSHVSSSSVEMLISAVEERVSPDTDVDILPGVDEALACQEIDLIHRFAARSETGHSLPAKCAEILFSKGDFLRAVRLSVTVLPKAIAVLRDDQRNVFALELINSVIESIKADSSLTNQALLSCLEELRSFDSENDTEAVDRMTGRCYALIPHVSSDALRVRCLCLVGELRSRVNSTNRANGFEQAFIVAYSAASSEQRFSHVVEICRSLIRVGEVERALSEFDAEIEEFACSVKLGDIECDFFLRESDGLAEIFGSCSSSPKVDRWMSRLVEATHDKGQMNTNGYYIGVFSEAISEFLRKLYRRQPSNHQNWIPAIVDTFYFQRPSSNFGEVRSISAAALSSFASVISLTGDVEKSLRFHNLARSECTKAYRDTGEEEFLHCAQESIRSGQIGEAFSYIDTYEQHSRGKDNSADWKWIQVAEALVDNRFYDQAAKLIREKAISSDHTTAQKWSVPASKLIAAFCEHRRFRECDEFFPLISAPSEEGVSALNNASAAAACAKKLNFLEAMWANATSLRSLIFHFRAALQAAENHDSIFRSGVIKCFDNQRIRLCGKEESLSTKALLSQALGNCGRYREAITLMGDSYRARSTKDYHQDIRGESIWNPSFVHDNCLGHLASTLAEARLVPLSLAFFSQIKGRRMWLNTFRTLCSLLANGDSETKDRFLNIARPTLENLSEDEDIFSEKSVKGLRLSSRLDVGMVEGLSHAAISILALSKLSIAKEIILVARNLMAPTVGSYEWKTFLSAAIQTQCSDVALDCTLEALGHAQTLHGCVEREELLTKLIGYIPLFTSQIERRKLLSRALGIVRKIWFQQREWVNFSDVIYAAARCGELKLARRLERFNSKRIFDQTWSGRTKAFIASEMAKHGEINTALEILRELPDSYSHSEAWSNVASRLAISGSREEAVEIYQAICSTIFSKFSKKILSKEFRPVFLSLNSVPNLNGFEGLIGGLICYPICDADLWESVLLLYGRSCFTQDERARIIERFAQNSLSELDSMEAPATKLSPEGQLQVIRLSNIAVMHLQPSSGWTALLKTKISVDASEGLNLSMIDFGKRLPWIRSFFALCSANPATTKMLVTELIAAYGYEHDLSAMGKIVRKLPEPELLNALSDAVAIMHFDAEKTAMALEENDRHDEALKVRISALEVSSQLLGSGENSVIEFADAIRSWPNLDRKLEYYRQAVASSESLYGKDNVNFCRLANETGILLSKKGAHEEALPFFTDSYNGYRLIIGSESDKTVSVLLNRGLALRNLGQFRQSIEDLRSVVETRRCSFGDSNPRTLRALDELAKTYMLEGAWEMAADALKVALSGEETTQRYGDPKNWNKLVTYQETRARRLLHLSEAQVANKRIVEAKGLIEESIELYYSLAADTRIAEDRKERGITLRLRAQMLLASVLDELGDLGNAVPAQQVVVETLKNLKGINDKLIFREQIYLSSLIFKSGDFQVCEILLRELIAKNPDEASDAYSNAVKGLARCLVKQGMSTGALTFVREQSEKSDILSKTLRSTLVRLECLAGDSNKAKSLAAEELASNPQTSAEIKSRWLADSDFGVIQSFLEAVDR
jgi:tetratricopeptide (TPR) repeat protein